CAAVAATPATRRHNCTAPARPPPAQTDRVPPPTRACPTTPATAAPVRRPATPAANPSTRSQRLTRTDENAARAGYQPAGSTRLPAPPRHRRRNAARRDAGATPANRHYDPPPAASPLPPATPTIKPAG